MPEIQRADPRARRKAVLLVAGGAVLGALLILLLDAYRPALEDWLTRDPAQAGGRFRLAFAVLAVAFAGPTLGFAGYFWRLGTRVVRAERFPPPGSAVVRDTAVLVGPPARRRGRALQSVAGLLVLVAAACAAVLWRLGALLEARAG